MVCRRKRGEYAILIGYSRSVGGFSPRRKDRKEGREQNRPGAGKRDPEIAFLRVSHYTEAE